MQFYLIKNEVSIQLGKQHSNLHFLVLSAFSCGCRLRLVHKALRRIVSKLKKGGGDWTNWVASVIQASSQMPCKEWPAR